MPSPIIYKKAAHEVWIEINQLCQLLPNLSKDYLLKKAFYAYRQKVSNCFRNKPFLPYVPDCSWRYGKLDGTFYIDYDTIADKAPTFYKTALPSKIELIQKAQNTATNQQDKGSLQQFIEAFLQNNVIKFYQYYGDCTKAQQTKLATAACFLEAAKAYIQATNTNSSGSDSIFKDLVQLIASADADYLPSHYRNFKQKLLPVLQGTPAHELVQLKRSNNQNAAVFCNDEQIESWIVNLRFSGKNFTEEYIIRKVQFMCTVFQKPTPSRRWVGTKMAEAQIKYITAGGRWGNSKHGQGYRGYTPFENALHAGDCWQVDGTRVNMTSFKQKVTIIDEETGKEKTVNKEAYLTVVAVRDVHSGDVLGYTYNLAENRWAYIEALKMAVQEANYLPYEIVFDKFPGHNTPEFMAFQADLELRGVKVTYTHKAEGKGKLERWFGTLQTVFMQESDYYYGEGVQSKRKAAHRSKEYLAHLRKVANKEGWNYDKAADEMSSCIEAYRSTKYSVYSRKFANLHQTPAEIHKASEKPNVIPIAADQYAYLFGLKRKAKIANEGLIDFEINGVTFNFRCEDINVVANQQTVLITYFLEDLTSINIYELNEGKAVKKFLGTATEISAINPYGPNAFEGYGKDKAIIRQLQEYKNQMLQYKMAVGFDDMGILQAGSTHKYISQDAEDAATQTLIEGNTANLSDYDVSDQY